MKDDRYKANNSTHVLLFNRAGQGSCIQRGRMHLQKKSPQRY